MSRPKHITNRLLTLIGLLVISGFAAAQNGTIKGKVIDDTGLGLPGANVIVDGTTKGTSTDFDGNYELSNLTPGEYTINFSSISFTNQSKTVTVGVDQEVEINITMTTQITVIRGAEVVVNERRGNVIAIDRMKKKSATVMDGMSQATIRENGDNNVASAVKRVSGVSVEGGKYVYVRGLSDRYSKSLVNGAEIPGLDPDRNSVQMDLFPSILIENVMISKGFTPDLPASFTGGLVNIETKDIPDSLIYNVRLSLGYNTNATFNSNFLTYEGGSLDWIGMDDGTRALPDVVANNEVQNAQGGDKELLTQQTRSFSKTWGATREAALPNMAFSLSVGNQKKLKSPGKTFGFNGALAYRRTSQFYENGVMGRYLLTGDYETSKQLIAQQEFNDSRGDETVLVGGLLNGSLRLNKRNSVGVVLFYNQSGTSSAQYQKGRIPSVDQDLVKEQVALRYLERNFTVGQLKGEHTMGKKDVEMDWIASVALSSQDTPDLRTFDSDYRVNNDGSVIYNINEAAYSAPNRYFREMSEINADVKVNFKVPIKIGADTTSTYFKFGGANVIKQRDFSERRYEFGRFNMQYPGSVDAYFTDANMDATSNSYIFVEDLTDLRNTYEAEEQVTSGYIMLDYVPFENIRIVAGARAEKAFIQATSRRFEEFTDEIERAKYRGTLDNLDILPSLNFTYKVNEKTNLRLAYSRTLARPAFRELAPFASFDFTTRYTKIGNPNLERTLIDNIDVRYEIYPNLGEIISFSAFYKQFQNPIELVINPQAANVELTWQNQEFATVYGGEFEIRKKLSFIKENWDKVTAGVNVTYVYSETKINEAELAEIRSTHPQHEETRPMFGQSPYIVNAVLNYKNDSTGWGVNLTYNVAGPKLALVIGGGTPNVYDQPRNSLNLAVSKKINNLQLRFRANNLLNAETQMKYNYKDQDYYFQRFDLGRTFSISASLNF